MSWTDKDAQANLWRVRGFVCLQSLDFSRGVFVVFLLTQGLTNTQVGVLQSLLFWTMFITEIPTGIFADHARRKVSIAIGLCLLAFTFALFPRAGSFAGYATLFVLWGLSSAFCSGASSALLFDGLKSAGPHWLDKHLREIGKLKAISVLCMAASMAMAGSIYAHHPEWVFQLTAGFTLAALAVLVQVKEGPRTPEGTSRNSGNVARALLAFSRGPQGRNMLLLIIGLSLLEACHTPLFILAQSLLKEMAVQPTEMTVVLALNFLVSAVGMYYAPRLKWRALQLPVLLTLGLMVVVILAIYGSSTPTWTEFALVMGNLLPNVIFVYTDHYIQENATSDIRASWGSVQSFLTSLAIGSSYIVIGYAGDLLGMRTAFLLFLVPLAFASTFVVAHSWRAIQHATTEAA